MPFYEYECSNCKYYTEVLQKVSDPPLAKCPSCGKKAFKKLISAPVFRLKGSGWYETDFKSDKEGKRNLAGADREESKSDDKKDASSKVGAGTAESSKPSDKPVDKPVDKPADKAAAKTADKAPVRSSRGAVQRRSKAAPKSTRKKSRR